MVSSWVPLFHVSLDLAADLAVVRLDPDPVEVLDAISSGGLARIHVHVVLRHEADAAKRFANPTSGTSTWGVVSWRTTDIRDLSVALPPAGRNRTAADRNKSRDVCADELVVCALCACLALQDGISAALGIDVNEDRLGLATDTIRFAIPYIPYSSCACTGMSGALVVKEAMVLAYISHWFGLGSPRMNLSPSLPRQPARKPIPEPGSVS